MANMLYQTGDQSDTVRFYQFCTVILLKHNKPQVFGRPRGFYRKPIHLLLFVSCTDWNLHLLGGVNVHGHKPGNYDIDQRPCCTLFDVISALTTNL